MYGRRRVGKTYLIKQFFSKRDVVLFEQKGLNKGKLKAQLEIFVESLSRAFYNGIRMAVPKNWMDALHQLTLSIDIYRDKQVVIFFDELPWLAARKSGFLVALEHFWNVY